MWVNLIEESKILHVRRDYQGIRSLLALFSSWDIKHVRRDYNKVAHVLAQFARQWELSQVWIGVCPPMLSDVIQTDCM